MPDAHDRDKDKTIADFGEQWTRFTENDGYYASQSMFADIVEPLLPVTAFQNAKCAEVGAGTGRIVQMMLRAGAAHVTAIEPSRAADVLERNLADEQQRLTIVREPGDQFRIEGLDIIVSIGVLHHIPDPRTVVDRMHAALTEGGHALVWLYGREGNGLYLAFAEPLRWITRRLPVSANSALAGLLYVPLAAYIGLCRWLPLPMRDYMRRVLAPMSGKDIRLVIVDQLNPQWAKYYTADEARQLLEQSGFANVRLHHRHGYSWSAIGTKAGTPTAINQAPA